MKNSEFRIQNSEFRIQNSEIRLLKLLMAICLTTSSLASCAKGEADNNTQQATITSSETSVTYEFP